MALYCSVPAGVPRTPESVCAQLAPATKDMITEISNARSERIVASLGLILRDRREQCLFTMGWVEYRSDHLGLRPTGHNRSAAAKLNFMDLPPPKRRRRPLGEPV